jgi:hypothetical protein
MLTPMPCEPGSFACIMLVQEEVKSRDFVWLYMLLVYDPPWATTFHNSTELQNHQ